MPLGRTAMTDTVAKRELPLVQPQSLSRLLPRLRSGELPLETYISAALDRLDQIEPAISSLLPENSRRERLLAEAAQLLQLYPDPEGRPPLFGALLGIKDLFAADGFATRAGSRLPPELFAMAEGPVVRRLKAAGALVLGKTVSTEFAYFSPGPTRNPHNPRHTPGGSSSGSAAAVAAGLCPLAIGTQTIGSIGRPAAFCGICGWKPSYDRTSRQGAVAFAASLDHVGLFAAGPADLELAAAIITDRWRELPPARPQDPWPVLAIPDGPYLQQAEAEALAVFEQTVGQLEARGCRIVRVSAMADIAKINERHRRIAAAELADTHKDWYPQHKELYSATTAELIEKGQAIAASQLAEDRQGQLKLRAELEQTLTENGAAFWLSPAAPGPAPEGITATGSPIMNLPWTHAGMPTLGLPAGKAANGMPLGLQIAAAFGQDEELLAFGHRLETV